MRQQDEWEVMKKCSVLGRKENLQSSVGKTCTTHQVQTKNQIHMWAPVWGGIRTRSTAMWKAGKVTTNPTWCHYDISVLTLWWNEIIFAFSKMKFQVWLFCQICRFFLPLFNNCTQSLGAYMFLHVTWLMLFVVVCLFLREKFLSLTEFSDRYQHRKKCTTNVPKPSSKV